MTYDVGYKKPPGHSKFKKGKSGNPKGRPKARHSVTLGLDIQSSLLNALSKPMTVTENGVKTSMTWLDALITRQVSDALKGDKQSMKTIMKTLKDFGYKVIQPLNPEKSFNDMLGEILKSVDGKTTGLPHEHEK